MSEEKNNIKIKPPIGFVLRIILLVVYTITLLIFYLTFINLGLNWFFSFLIFLFFFLVVFGPILKGIRRSYYSRLFPDKNRRKKSHYQKFKSNQKLEQDTINLRKRAVRPVNLKITYKKTLIRKCDNCGMILTSFVKKCPFCGEVVKAL